MSFKLDRSPKCSGWETLADNPYYISHSIQRSQRLADGQDLTAMIITLIPVQRSRRVGGWFFTDFHSCIRPDFFLCGKQDRLLALPSLFWGQALTLAAIWAWYEAEALALDALPPFHGVSRFFALACALAGLKR